MNELNICKNLNNLEVESMSFDQMYQAQLELEKFIFKNKLDLDFENLSIEQRVVWIEKFIVCVEDELHELLNFLPWKHWKNYSESIDIEEVKYEFIDILHFVLVLGHLIGFKNVDEIGSYYARKNSENYNRQERNY